MAYRSQNQRVTIFPSYRCLLSSYQSKRKQLKEVLAMAPLAYLALVAQPLVVHLDVNSELQQVFSGAVVMRCSQQQEQERQRHPLMQVLELAVVYLDPNVETFSLALQYSLKPYHYNIQITRKMQHNYSLNATVIP